MELEAIELRKKRESEARELISEQRETMKNYNYDRDMKTFLKPHDDAPPNMLSFILRAVHEPSRTERTFARAWLVYKPNRAERLI
ncbi:hypothetical protein HanIR_Chr14g0703961 [Helianthus annuus]|nr:hypothetical protein HanIR_Chr14g0703961 [Helianthus annuus]